MTDQGEVLTISDKTYYFPMRKGIRMIVISKKKPEKNND